MVSSAIVASGSGVVMPVQTVVSVFIGADSMPARQLSGTNL